ncbi:MAG TPA: LytR C-terminal domain-containing protein [Patescibacteria group bacterium]|nr:LytR C-terminal domain-containing protein [bacterium]HRY56580.1 LytR C-terminal domain-containing protein [Patescibacteria group bacterium]
MQDLVVSINKNILKISTIDKEAQLKTAMLNVPKELVDDTRIIDPKGFSNLLEKSISQVSVLSKNKLGLNFVMEPQDIFLRYVTVSKNGQETGEQIISEIKAKDPDIKLDTLYFSYKKMAPFVYQFVGIRKEVMDNYLETSNALNIGLKSIIPWVLAFPKYENVNDPAIFVSKVDNDQVIALSELNGIFFAGTYKKEKTSEELTSLVKELSFYKRSSPIKCIFTFNCDSFTMPNYEIKKIESPKFNGNFNLPEGFEINNIVNFLLDSDPTILGGQINVLNMLPLPVVERKGSALLVTGSVIGALLLLVGAYFGITSLGNKKAGNEQLAQNNTSQETQVLSETTSQEQPVQEEQSQQGTENENPEKDPNVEVKRGNLKIRVENGAGVGGLAARTKEYLEGLGYTVLTIDTADSKVQPTVLQFKSTVQKEFENLVKEDIKTKFPEIEVKDNISEDSDYDLLITVGTSSEL